LRLLQADVFLTDVLWFSDARSVASTPSLLPALGRGEDIYNAPGDPGAALEVDEALSPFDTLHIARILRSKDLAFDSRGELRLLGEVAFVGATLNFFLHSADTLRAFGPAIPESLLRQAAPLCFEASSKCARLAGFLRYVQGNNLATWNSLIRAVEGKVAEPKVRTPDEFAGVIRGYPNPGEQARQVALGVLAALALVVGLVLWRRLRRLRLARQGAERAVRALIDESRKPG
jgi:hypothetical protein